MDTVERYGYSEKQRSFMEISVIPFAVFRRNKEKIQTILVSDGLCRLLNRNREKTAAYLDKDIFLDIHPDDRNTIQKNSDCFFLESGELNTSFRMTAGGDGKYCTVYLNGKRILSDKGEKLFLVWYNVACTAENAKSNSEQKNEFDEFLKGESNALSFYTFGYKGYSIWNVTQNTLLSESGLEYSAALLDDDFGYRDYYLLNKGWLCEEEDMDFFRSLSPEAIMENFKNEVTPQCHIFTFGSNSGQISIKITPFVAQSPENGDIYLKLQAENVTDSVVYETMLHSSAKTSEFIAYIDGNADSVYFINTQSDTEKSQTKVPIAKMLPIFSANFGEDFKNAGQLFSFIDRKCGYQSNATVINKISNECIKSIRMEIIDKKERQYFICGSDVTALMQMEVSSYYDDLTGLPNMAAFRMIAQPAMEKMKAEGKIPVLVYFDLRDMKAINEKYSFERGNGVLIGTAYILREVFVGNPVSRLAEDHFVVLTDRRSIEQRIELVYEKVLNNPIGIPIQICAGIYVDNGRKLDIAAACDRARLACKSLKEDYNRKYRIFDHEMFVDYHKRRHILTHFEEALEKGYIKVYYHPIIRCLTGNICDMEALSRWIDPEKGVLQPAQFIAVLEEHRLIHKLDFYMIHKICENLEMQRTRNLPLVPVSVNLSRIDFEMCDVVEEVTKIVDSYRIPHQLLTIEITESAFIHNLHFLNYQINRFREAGFDVWMDDFGSEYSSLNTLQEFTFDLIKLDKKFMDNFSLTGKNFSILSDVIGMVSKLRIHTLAEGVETKEQLHFLRDIGCEKAQGYLFSSPMPCEYFVDQYLKNTGLGYDDFRMSEYYDKIGAVRLDNSVLSEYRINIGDIALNIPSAVIEYRCGKFKILKANQAYKKFLSKLGLNDCLIDGEYQEWKQQPSKEFTRVAVKCLVTHSSESVSDDLENGYMVSAQLICISYRFSTDTGAFITIVENYKKRSG